MQYYYIVLGSRVLNQSACYTRVLSQSAALDFCIVPECFPRALYCIKMQYCTRFKHYIRVQYCTIMQYCTRMQHCTTLNIATEYNILHHSTKLHYRVLCYTRESCTREYHIATDDVPEAIPVSKILHQSVALDS